MFRDLEEELLLTVHFDNQDAHHLTSPGFRLAARVVILAQDLPLKEMPDVMLNTLSGGTNSSTCICVTKESTLARMVRRLLFVYRGLRWLRECSLYAILPDPCLVSPKTWYTVCFV